MLTLLLLLLQLWLPLLLLQLWLLLLLLQLWLLLLLQQRKRLAVTEDAVGSSRRVLFWGMRRSCSP